MNTIPFRYSVGWFQWRTEKVSFRSAFSVRWTTSTRFSFFHWSWVISSFYTLVLQPSFRLSCTIDGFRCCRDRTILFVNLNLFTLLLFFPFFLSLGYLCRQTYSRWIAYRACVKCGPVIRTLGTLADTYLPISTWRPHRESAMHLQ